MLSLPDEWDFTLSGLIPYQKGEDDAQHSALDEKRHIMLLSFYNFATVTKAYQLN